MAKKKRDELRGLNIRVTREEYEIIQAKARAARLSLAAFARAACLGCDAEIVIKRS